MKETEKIKVNSKSKDDKNNEEHRKWIQWIIAENSSD